MVGTYMDTRFASGKMNIRKVVDLAYRRRGNSLYIIKQDTTAHNPYKKETDTLAHEKAGIIIQINGRHKGTLGS